MVELSLLALSVREVLKPRYSAGQYCSDSLGKSLYLLLDLFFGHDSDGLCGSEEAGWVCGSSGHVEGANLLRAFDEVLSRRS